MVFKHLSIYLTDLPETPIRAIPREITRISISPNTDVFIDNTTGKLLNRAAMKGLDRNMEAENLRSKIARRSEAIVDSDVPLNYPSINVTRSSNAVVGVAHSCRGYDIAGDFHSSSPSPAYSYAGVSAGLGYMPKLEASFMRDFGCCGQTLPTLHDLLEHYKAEHAQQTPQSIRPINSTVGSTMEGEKERKPFRCPVIGQTLPTLHDLSEHYEAEHAQQTPQSIRPINSTVGSTMEEEKERKPFRCPVIGCENTYKNQNGLKYVPQTLVEQN